jgi:hypothetical protein
MQRRRKAPGVADKMLLSTWTKAAIAKKAKGSLLGREKQEERLFLGP